MPDIDFQRIELNLIPKKGDEPVIFYASQYETTRPFIADIMWGETAFAPGDDCWAEIDIRKNDDNLVVITDDVAIDNNEVSVILPVQALTCIGKNLGQVKIYAGEDQLIAALNFILEVQPDPLAGGVTSETAIDNLTEQIEEITQQVIGDDYYNKTEVDSALALKADKSDTYTKTQVDTALASKANTADLATVATTGDYDDLINKPSIPAAQVQSDWEEEDVSDVSYIKNKPDIDTMIADALFAVMPVGSVGPSAIANFETELAAPLQSVIVDVVASQASGTPTPSTPLPITGYSSANITRCGVNFLKLNNGTHTIRDVNVTVSNGTITANGTANSGGGRTTKLSDVFTLKAGTYYIKGFGNDTELRPYLSKNADDSQVNTGDNRTFTLAEDTAVYFGVNVTNGHIYTNATMTPVVVIGTTAPTVYTPYNGQTYAIAFGQTVYGGVLDVTRGKLHVTHSIVDLGSLTWYYGSAQTAFYTGSISGLKTKGDIKCSIYETNIASVGVLSDNQISTWNSYVDSGIITKDSRYSDAASYKTAMSGINAVYELATPFDIDLTPEVILAIVGENNVYSDTGDTTVRYKDSIQHYIDQRT